MKKLLLAAILALFVAGRIPAYAESPASEGIAVMSVPNQFLYGFNKGDAKMMLAVDSGHMSVIDEFLPHEWHGPGAFAKWFSDYDVDAKKNGITDGTVTFGKPTHLEITADRAYVVVPADYAFNRNGKPEGEVCSIITITLKKTASGWLITRWAWTTPDSLFDCPLAWADGYGPVQIALKEPNLGTCSPILGLSHCPTVFLLRSPGDTARNTPLDRPPFPATRRRGPGNFLVQRPKATFGDAEGNAFGVQISKPRKKGGYSGDITSI